MLALRVVWTTAVLGIMASAAQAVEPTATELELAGRFAEKLTGEAAGLPFSFTYAGKPSSEWLKAWKRSESTERLDEARTRKTITWADPATRLEVRLEAVVYSDFPAVEWTVHFRNSGQNDSPILENVAALDASWQRNWDDEFLLHHAYGSQAGPQDYGPRQTPLPPGAAHRLAGAGGRPTNVDWSYFNLQFGKEGVIGAVGWPGQWAASFTRDAERGLHVVAGQEQVRTKLLPGEGFRTPLMALLFWQGNHARSQNLWRRWMIAHNVPRPGGRLPPPQFVASSSRAYEEMIKANEQNQIMHVDRYLEEGVKLDYWWMDAGWYVQKQGWPQVGTWEVDARRFPRGLRPISDHAHSKGVKIIVWFEPERVMPGTWLYENKPEWLLRPDGSQNPLAGLRSWSSRGLGGSDPCVNRNLSDQPVSTAGIVWDPGRLAFHPGPKGEYSVVRWTAPEAGEYAVAAKFLAIDQNTTTDVHVFHAGRPVWDGWIRLHDQGKEASYDGKLAVATGETLDFVVGWGNGAHVCDSTGLEVLITGPSGTVWDAASQFDPEKNPTAAWSYGYLPPDAAPESSQFALYDHAGRAGEGGVRLLNMGNAAAREWLTDHIDRLITEQGIDLYRQDFNIDPLGFWRANDEPDRQGMTENRYVAGYLAYWDELRRRHPDMLIDSCASGGRRNDLETMRRAVPLWRSDYAYEPIGHQSMTYGISLWLPYHGTGTVASSAAPYYGGGYTDVEPYAFWSNAAPSLGSGIDVRVREIDYDSLRRLVGQWRELSRYYYADFYPLTPYPQDAAQWIAWQFHDPERGEGAVQAFRRAKSETGEMRLVLHDLKPEATYTLTVFDTPGTSEATGRQLMTEGLHVELPQSPSAAVVVYRAR